MPVQRPAFYNENADLQSIEILAWAAEQDCFTSRAVRTHFTNQLNGYKDPVHEVSERLRKLVRSSNLFVANEAVVQYQASKELEIANGNKTPLLPNAQANEILARLSIMAEEAARLKRRGRPEHLYFANAKTRKYVESRKTDLDVIRKSRQ